MQDYEIVLEWDSEAGVWVAFVPALNGLSTFGETKEEALANTREAILGYLEAARQAFDEMLTQYPEDRAEAALQELHSSRE